MTVGEAREPEVKKKPPNLNVWRRALGRLKRDGLARTADVSLKQSGGRRGVREYAFYLSDSRKGEAIVRGARACGIKAKKKATECYGRVGLPGNHARVRNDIYIAMILQAAAVNERVGRVAVEVPLDGMWAESCPEYPLRGEKITTDEAGKKLTGFELQKAGYVQIYPDGRFRARFPNNRMHYHGKVELHDLDCVYDVELETGTRSKAVMEKIDERAACYLRMLDLHRQAAKERRRAKGEPAVRPDVFVGLPEGLVPVLFWMQSDVTAKNMRDRVKAALEAGDEALSSLAELRDRPELQPTRKQMDSGEKYWEGGAAVGRYFLFAGIDRLQPHPFAPNYYPLSRYPAHLEAQTVEGRLPLPLITQEITEARLHRAQHHDAELWANEAKNTGDETEGWEPQA